MAKPKPKRGWAVQYDDGSLYKNGSDSVAVWRIKGCAQEGCLAVREMQWPLRAKVVRVEYIEPRVIE